MVMTLGVIWIFVLKWIFKNQIDKTNKKPKTKKIYQGYSSTQEARLIPIKTSNKSGMMRNT